MIATLAIIFGCFVCVLMGVGIGLQMNEEVPCPSITCEYTGDTVKIPKDQMKFIGDAILPAANGFKVTYPDGITYTYETLDCDRLSFWFYAVQDETYLHMDPADFLDHLKTLVDMYGEYYFRCR